MKQRKNISSSKGTRDLRSMSSKKNTVSSVNRPAPKQRTSVTKKQNVQSQKAKTKKVPKPQKHGLLVEHKMLVIGIITAVVISLIIIAFIVFFWSNNKDNDDSIKSDNVKTENNNSNSNALSDDISKPKSEVFDVEFSEIKINGTMEAIIHAKLLSVRVHDDIYSIEITNDDGFEFETNASILGDGLYAKVTGLSPSTEYQVVVYKQIDESTEKEKAPTLSTFSTPERKHSIEEIESLLATTCDRTVSSLSEEKQILFESQAAMKILGMDISEYGRMEALTQVNQVMLDYSFNSYDNFVFWNNINETPTKESNELLKDVLSVDKNITKDDLVREFQVCPYSMTDYIKYDHHGGQISSETYVFDKMKDDSNSTGFYAEYPYDVDTPEFQTKYESLINGSLSEDSDEMKELIETFGIETFEQSDPDEIYASIAAKNKVLFSQYCDWWLEDIAVLPEKRIYLYSESGRHSMDSMLSPTMVAFAYMYVEYREMTGNDLTVNNCYRSGDVQWDKYSKGYGEEKVMEWSGKWHKERQLVSYVPGYSNHQLAASIDFEPAQYAFIRSEEYKYLSNNAAKYSVYNYAIEPWHWTYLGKYIEEDVIESTPLATPLPEE